MCAVSIGGHCSRDGTPRGLPACGGRTGVPTRTECIIWIEVAAMDKHGFFIFGTGNSLYATIVEGVARGPRRSRTAQKLTRRQVRPPSLVSISWPTKPLAAGPWMTTPSLAVVNPRSAQPCPPSGSVTTVCHCAAPLPE